MVTTPTIAEVKEIITTDLADGVITNLIAETALMVEGCVSGLSSDRQEAIVKWVTAHTIYMLDQKGGGTVTSKKLGDAQTNYAALPLGQGLKGSFYGQQALNLDPNGCLAYIGVKGAKLRVL